MIDKIRAKVSSLTGSDLSRKFSQGAILLSMLRAGQRVAAFLGSIVIARVLGPAEAGVANVALIALTWMMFLVQTGIDDFLIRKQGDAPEYVPTAMTLRIGRGVLIGAAIYLAAPYAAAFLSEPRSVNAIRLLSLNVLIVELANPYLVVHQAGLQMKRVVIVQASEAFTNVIVMITLVFVLHSYWAITIGTLASVCVSTVMSYILIRPWGRPGWNREHAKEIGAFGRWVGLYNSLNFLSYSVDSLMVSHVTGSRNLALYENGRRLASAATQDAMAVLQNMLFPTFTMVADDMERTRRVLLKICGTLTLVLIPVSIAVGVWAGWLVPAVFGEKWRLSGAVASGFALTWIFVPLGFVGKNVINAAGKPRTSAIPLIIRFLIIVAFGPAIAKAYGIVGMVSLVGFTRLLADGMVAVFLIPIVGGKTVGKMMSGVIATAILTAFFVGAGRWLGSYVQSNLINLVLLFVTTLVSWGAAYKINRLIGREDVSVLSIG